jgi:toxin ParE1/3/4
MRVVVRAKAADDLDEIYAWIAKENPSAAVLTVRRLRARFEQLSTPGLERMGRRGLIRDTLELVEPPYIIIYRVDEARGQVQSLQSCMAPVSGRARGGSSAGRRADLPGSSS